MKMPMSRPWNNIPLTRARRSDLFEYTYIFGQHFSKLKIKQKKSRFTSVRFISLNYRTVIYSLNIFLYETTVFQPVQGHAFCR